jgi:capsular polysaccharide biosynthesis protein
MEKTVGSALRNHARAILGVTMCCLLIAAIAIFVRPPTYAATVTLVVDERQSSPAGSDPSAAAQVMAQEYIELATSRPLATQVCNSVGKQVPCDPESLARHTSASLAQNTTIINLTVGASSPEDAATLANAAANELVSEARTLASQQVKSQIDYLNDQITQLNQQISAEQEALGNSNENAAVHQSRLTQLQSEYTYLYQKLQDLQVSGKSFGNDLNIVQQASPPSRPVDPDPVRYLAVALVAGLALGAMLALLLERWDHRLRRGQALAEAAGLGLVIEEGGPGLHGEDLSDRAYTLARASLISRYPGARTVLMVAASTGDDVDDAASALSRAAAAFGQRVLVLESALGLDRNGGEPRRRRLQSGRGAITIAGLAPPDLAPALAAEQDEYDLTVLAVPSPAVSPLAIMLANKADVIVLVATAGQTTIEEAREATALLRGSGAEVAAGILVADGKGAETPPNGRDRA